MNWSSVKNFLIAILVAANLFLIYNIVRQERALSYIPEKDVDAVIELLSERGLDVPRGCIPLERFSAPVYESLYSDAYYTDVAQTLTGSPRELLLSPPEGGFSVTLQNGAVFDFDSEFGFSYRKYDKFNANAYTEITAENFASEAVLWDDIGTSLMKTLTEKAKAFLDGCRGEGHIMHTEIIGGFRDSGSGYSCVLAKQLIDSYEVCSHYAVCIFDGEELVYAGGRWYFAPLGSSYDTELIDQLNILFSDLETQTAMIAVPYTVSDSTNDSSETVTLTGDQLSGSGKLPPVSGIKPCYVIYWNAGKTALYFIPAWQIEHIGSPDAVYNATNGTLYTIN